MEKSAREILNEYDKDINACIEALRDKIGMLKKEQDNCEDEILKLKMKRAVIDRCATYGFSNAVGECVLDEIDEMTSKQRKAYCEILEKFGISL